MHQGPAILHERPPREHARPRERAGDLSHARILILPTLVANQIAAGEVVERPASVVKELIENALDALPTRVRIELDQGGIELVRVTDDGVGIPREDLPLALAPHATSKIADARDLDHIATLGFRGEALASIASVSRLALRSRTPESTQAWEVAVEGATVGDAKPAAGSVGTSVTVRNLFYNTPARRKFLRTAQTEKERCAEVVELLAFAHPSVAFELVIDGKQTLDLPMGQGPRSRALALLGRELEPQLLEVKADRFDDARGVTLWGFAGLPSLGRGSAKAQRIFVNGRPVRDRSIQHAIAEAYRGIIEPGRYATVLLMLELSPEGVDVNVHPQKAEVRFRDSSMVHSVVLRALREGLQRADLTPRISDLRPAAWSPWSGNVSRELLGAATPDGAGLPYAAARAMLPEPEPDSRAERFAAFFGVYKPPPDAAHRESERANGRTREEHDWDAPQSSPDREITRPSLLQIRNSFVVTQDDQGVVIIDQHALHERAMFEHLSARVLASGSLESQRMLVPLAVGLPSGQPELLPSLAPLFAAIGVECRQLSPTSVGVESFPSFLFERGVDAGLFVAELFRKAEAGEFAALSKDAVNPAAPRAVGEHALRDVLDMMACKAAIRAGDHLTGTELTELVKLREDVERSSNCPHGRPTSIRLTFKELEKLFGRS